MEKKRIVVALGGNALGNTPEEQEKAVSAAARAIAELRAEGHELIIGHGNGPQVGMIHQALNDAGKNARAPFLMPGSICRERSRRNCTAAGFVIRSSAL